MKLLGTVLIFTGAALAAKTYIDRLKRWLENLEDCIKILRCWSNWIIQYSYSVNELIEHTTNDNETSSLGFARLFVDCNCDGLIALLSDGDLLEVSDRNVMVSLLENIGSSLTQTETQRIEECVALLTDSKTKKESLLTERRSLLLKIVPLICAAIAVILW